MLPTEKQISKMKGVQLEILIEFARFCSTYDIKYQITAGTLLGAVRHKGFIPWDDDIDVLMLREDYEKFLNLAKQLFNKAYFVQNYKSDKKVFHYITRIRKKNTLALQDTTKYLDIHQGIWIDLFPVDKLPDNQIAFKTEMLILWCLNNLKILKLKKRAFRSRNNMLLTLKVLIYFILKPVPLYFFNSLKDLVIKKFYIFKGEKYSLLSESDLIDLKNYTFHKKLYQEYAKLEFEGHKFLSPKDYHYFLSKVFGNYMELPSEDERVSSHEIIKILIKSNSGDNE